jgi:hypothetical protein
MKRINLAMGSKGNNRYALLQQHLYKKKWDQDGRLYEPKKDRQRMRRSPHVYVARQKRVLNPQGVEDRYVIGKRMLCDEGSGDERIKHLKEWETGWRSQ